MIPRRVPPSMRVVGAFAALTTLMTWPLAAGVNPANAPHPAVIAAVRTNARRTRRPNQVRCMNSLSRADEWPLRA